MKKFFTHPAGIIITLVIVIVAAYYIGNSQWLKNMLASKPTPPADGTPCKDTHNNQGKYKGGICIPDTAVNTNQGNPSGRIPVQENIVSPLLQATNNLSNIIAVPRGVINCQQTYPYGGLLYQYMYTKGNYCYYKKP